MKGNWGLWLARTSIFGGNVAILTAVRSSSLASISPLLVLLLILDLMVLFLERSRRRITGPPGARLAALAKAVCTKKFYVRVLEPVLVDMEKEYIEALDEGKPGKARLLWVYYTVAFWWIALSQVPRSVLKLVTSFWRIG